jgi:hypothetical protein
MEIYLVGIIHDLMHVLDPVINKIGHVRIHYFDKLLDEDSIFLRNLTESNQLINEIALVEDFTLYRLITFTVCQD